jgi:sulfur carrier protein ThiS
MQSHEAEEVLTGVLYVNTTAPNFIDMINMTDEPLATLPEASPVPRARRWRSAWRSCDNLERDL